MNVLRPNIGVQTWFKMVAGLLLMLSVGTAQSVEIEHWSCRGQYGNTIWTIADNRMFVPKGKGSFQVLSNTPSLAVAYLIHLNGKDAVSLVLVLDKIGHKLIEYDDSKAAIFKGNFNQPLEPDVMISNCTPSRP